MFHVITYFGPFKMYNRLIYIYMYINFINISAIRVDSDWSTPEETVIGQIGGIATDSTRNVHVFHRGDRIWDYLYVKMFTKQVV